MNIDRLVRNTKDHEGFRSKVYTDSLGFETVGYGFTIKDLVLPEGVSSTLLRIILMERVIKLQEKLDWFNSMPNVVQEVIVEMTYQMGISGFLKFKKTIAFMKKKQFKKASLEMLRSQWAEKQSPNRALEMSNIVKDA